MALRASLSFALALALTLLSVFVQREGPEVEAYGNLCGPAGNQDCYKPALKGGFPFAYLSDQPGVSVERQLSFGEDTLHPAALALDIAIYWSALMLALRFAKRMSVASSSTKRRSEALALRSSRGSPPAWQLYESSGFNERLNMEQSSVAVCASHDHQLQPPFPATFGLGDRVRKKSGAAWQGRIVGWDSTQLTPEGYAVESEAQPGSVQIYPVAALERVA